MPRPLVVKVWAVVALSITWPLLALNVPPVLLKAPTTFRSPLVDLKVPNDRLKLPPIVMALSLPLKVPLLCVKSPLVVTVTPDGHRDGDVDRDADGRHRYR